jgi:hypothetical protein
MAMFSCAEKEGEIMGVMLQAFYWDCPLSRNREHQMVDIH